MKLLKCGMACCVFLSIVAWQTKYTSLQPTDAKGFIVEIQKKYAEVQAVKKKGNQEEIENKIKAVHRRLTRTYPVYYDWWLQDGKTGDVDWFSKSFNQELSVRLQKLNINTSVTNTPESIETAFQSYLKACEQRRIKRLTAFTADKPEIVFTKYRTLRPSFFAYTEGVSDARAECNYIAGGALAKLKMNGIWAEVETLLTDEEGVVRDPNLHFDGQHLLFSWKKSRKEDDFHLYEIYGSQQYVSLR